ncbi:class II fumarate hydratase [Muricomes intestini]|uniref:class II fumarate hydratase n=1 Tax=Muricomes intestini TaxID=1796634 RepID=UPI002FE37D53
MEYRIEHDTMGEVRVPKEHFWGAQTQRSLENFMIGEETMPRGVIRAFAYLKKAAAAANRHFRKLDEEKYTVIANACDQILAGERWQEFPLKVWQTGSGTQSNMNVNEVIAHLAGERIHPNDHVNMSQSSNDTFPSAMNIAAVLAVTEQVLPALRRLAGEFARLEKENEGIIKSGRTHLMDATPIAFSQEISGWRGMLEEIENMLYASLNHLHKLAIGGTAVGTGINAPEGFDVQVTKHLTELTGVEFIPDENKFHALTSKDAYVFAHGALKALAANLMKIANDVRWMASGPRCGLGEIQIPANEPGSSIMPGKVNPTQCEAVTMVAVQVMGNDAAIGIAASQGNFELNVFMPVCAYNFLQSARLLGDVMDSFCTHCVKGIRAERENMENYLNNSLMLVTALSPTVGYENAAKIAKKAFAENISLKEAAMKLKLISEDEFDRLMHYEEMI